MGRLYLLTSSGFSIKNITLPGGENYVYRSTLDTDGNFRLYGHSFDENGTPEGTILWSAVENPCSVKGICGWNSYCTFENLEPICICLPGFDFNNPESKEEGCKSRQIGDKNCGNAINKSNLTMIQLDNSWWGNEGYELLSMNKEECTKACLEDCYCSAAMLVDDGCLKMDLPLMYGRKEVDIMSKSYIKVAMDLKREGKERGKERERGATERKGPRGEGEREGQTDRERNDRRDEKGSNNKWFVIGLLLSIFSVILFICSAGLLALFFVCGVGRDRRNSPESNLVSDNSI